MYSRFIINVPEEELQEIERICFQIEQAHWFYDDFVREQNRSLPSMTLKTFAGRMFKHCPLLSQWAHDSDMAYQTFLEYKFKVPVCGAIILNQMLDKVLLVKGWSSRASWGFPRGKINKDEPEWQCAQREVIEETGFDILPYLEEEERIEITQADQKVLLYIIAGIDEDTVFMPTTRKEISQIQWHYLEDLPCSKRVDRKGVADGQSGGTPTKSSDKEHRYYLIKPFVKRIKTWVARHPERIGQTAVVVNESGHHLTQYNARAEGHGGGSGGGVQGLGGSGAMTVQEFFDTINQRAKSSADGAGDTDLAAALDAGGGATSSLLQTLMGGSNNNATEQMQADNDKLSALANLIQQTGNTATPPASSLHMQAVVEHHTDTSNGGVDGNGRHGGGAALKGFAFDAKHIMNAFTDANA